MCNVTVRGGRKGGNKREVGEGGREGMGGKSFEISVETGNSKPKHRAESFQSTGPRVLILVSQLEI